MTILPLLTGEGSETWRLAAWSQRVRVWAVNRLLAVTLTNSD